MEEESRHGLLGLRTLRAIDVPDDGLRWDSGQSNVFADAQINRRHSGGVD